MEFKELNPENLERAANMLKAIAHPIRISIVGCLEDGKKKLLQKFINSLELNNQLLRIILEFLKDRGVLASKREGKNTWYFLKHENPENNSGMCRRLLSSNRS